MRALRRLHAPAPVSLPGRAEADLRFIRGTMERSGTFTAVPGIGGMAMGVIAIAAAAFAYRASGPREWLAIWSAAAGVAVLVGSWAMIRKARGQGVSLLAGPGRRFLLCLCPALFAGAALSMILVRADRPDLLPAVWLLVYGAGVTAAGAFSTRIVPFTGAAFLACGATCGALPSVWGDVFMAAGFGGIHLASGFIVARRHGG